MNRARDIGAQLSYTSLFGLFKIGIGPSSSHTVGPMVAARQFAEGFAAIRELSVTLHGSLALTGDGHGTLRAIVLGLRGETPERVDIERASHALDDLDRDGGLEMLNSGFVPMTRNDFALTTQIHSAHPNVMTFRAMTDSGAVERSYASVGGGFVVALDGDELPSATNAEPVTLEYGSADELLQLCRERSWSIAQVAMENERCWRTDDQIDGGVRRIIDVMRASIDRGMGQEGTLPGLGVRRRARDLGQQLAEPSAARALPPTEPADWAGVFATAVSEENAAGGRIVTAPTNGAAGIAPAVLRFMTDFCKPTVPDPEFEFMLTAAAIGSLIKTNAGISGAELGCQGEVGSAAAMTAAGLAAALGGSPAQVENAAEIALEHNLGLTCDPVGGFVQIPCIERNAVGAVTAITAASLALRGDGSHVVSLDAAIETMRQTGADMSHKYKETSLGGLAVNVADC